MRISTRPLLGSTTVLLALFALLAPVSADLDTIEAEFAEREDAVLHDLNVEHVSALSAYVTANPDAEDREDAFLAWLNRAMQSGLFVEARRAAIGHRAAFPESRHAARVLALHYMSVLQDDSLSKESAVTEAKAIIAEWLSDKTRDASQALEMRLSLADYLIRRDALDEAIAELDALLTHPAMEREASFRTHVERTKAYAVSIGKPFDDFAVRDTAGQDLSAGRFNGKVVLVDFWATWCLPCIQELPDLLDLYEEYQPHGFEIIGVSLDSNASAFQTFLAKWELPWVQYVDASKGPYNALARKYNITQIPRSFLIDREGNLYRRDLRGDALHKAVQTLTASATP